MNPDGQMDYSTLFGYTGSGEAGAPINVKSGSYLDNLLKLGAGKSTLDTPVTTPAIDPATGVVSPSNKKGLDWGMSGFGGLALGGGQLALGLMSYLDQAKTAEKNRRLMDQQISNNNYVMDKRKANSTGLAQAFNSYVG